MTWPSTMTTGPINMNKVAPGIYGSVTTVSSAAVTIADKGTVAMGLEMDWGKEGIQEMKSSDFIKSAKAVFGYGPTAPQLADVRDIFKRANKLIFYRLNAAGATKALCRYATAKYAGPRGNDITIVVSPNVDDATKWDFTTYFETTLVDEQKGVAGLSELQSNDYVEWVSDPDVSITTGTVSLTTGANGAVTGDAHASFLDAVDPYTFDAIGYQGEDTATAGLYTAYLKDSINNKGKLFNLVLYGAEIDSRHGYKVTNGVQYVPWFLGAVGGVGVGKSLTNSAYDGEAAGNTDLTSTALEDVIDSCEIALHRDGDRVVVFKDMTNLININPDENEVMRTGDVVRTIDTYIQTVATQWYLRCLGKERNDDIGRATLRQIAIETGRLLQDTYRALQYFEEDDIECIAGNSKTSVVLNAALNPTGAMEVLYLSVNVE